MAGRYIDVYIWRLMILSLNIGQGKETLPIYYRDNQIIKKIKF